MSSTDRSPWASTSTISARRPLASALATSANPSNSASLAARSPMDGIMNFRSRIVKSSNDYLTMRLYGYRFNGMAVVTHATTVMPFAADAVFGTLTDIARLPEWNSVMTSVIQQHLWTWEVTDDRQLARTEIPASLAALARPSVE